MPVKDTIKPSVSFWLSIASFGLTILGAIIGLTLYISKIKEDNILLSGKYDTVIVEIRNVNDKIGTLAVQVNKLQDLHLKSVAKSNIQEKRLLNLSKSFPISESALLKKETIPIPISPPFPPLIPLIAMNKEILCKKEYRFFTPNLKMGQ